MKNVFKYQYLQTLPAPNDDKCILGLHRQPSFVYTNTMQHCHQMLGWICVVQKSYHNVDRLVYRTAYGIAMQTIKFKTIKKNYQPENKNKTETMNFEFNLLLCHP